MLHASPITSAIQFTNTERWDRYASNIGLSWLEAVTAMNVIADKISD